MDNTIRITDNTIQQSDNTIQQTDNTIQQTDNTIQQTDNTIQQSDNRTQHTDNTIQHKDNIIQHPDNTIQQTDNRTQHTDNTIQHTDNTTIKQAAATPTEEKAPDRVIVVVSHPHGQPKQVSVGDWVRSRNVVVRPGRQGGQIHQWCEYATDTCPGSSGASVLVFLVSFGGFNCSWKLALHRNCLNFYIYSRA